MLEWEYRCRHEQDMCRIEYLQQGLTPPVQPAGRVVGRLTQIFKFNSQRVHRLLAEFGHTAFAYANCSCHPRQKFAAREDK